MIIYLNVDNNRCFLLPGILGFETGYSYYSPHQLSIWEAQYGDFADTAQPVFDTFTCNGESKWICQSALVVALPHGIDGAVRHVHIAYQDKTLEGKGNFWLACIEKGSILFSIQSSPLSFTGRRCVSNILGYHNNLAEEAAYLFATLYE